MTRIIFAILIILPSIGCRNRHETSKLQNSTQSNPASTLELALLKVGGKLPNESVRYPMTYEKFVRTLEQKLGLQSLNALVPVSRSLQRDSVTFQFPRIISGFFSPESGALDMGRESRLFLGYSELADAAEAISFNAATGVYDFFILRGFATPEGFTVSKAPRKQCESCHAGSLPIFTPRAWDDTNANPEYAKAILEANGKRPNYLFVKIDVADEQDSPSDRAAEFGDISALDNNILRSDGYVNASLFWNYGCDRQKLKMCRKQFLKIQFMRMKYGTEVKAFADPEFTREFRTAFDFIDSRYLKEPFPITPRGLNNISVAPTEAARVFAEIERHRTDALRKKRSPHETRNELRGIFDQMLPTIAGSSPTKGFQERSINPPNLENLTNVFAQGFVGDFLMYQAFDRNETTHIVERMRPHLSKILAALDSDQADEILDTPHFTREKILRFAQKVTGSFDDLLTPPTSSELFEPTIAEIDAKESIVDPPALVLIRRNCSECHGPVSGKETRILIDSNSGKTIELLRSNKKAILPLLRSGDKMMPPAEYQRAHPVPQKDMDAMRAFIERL